MMTPSTALLPVSSIGATPLQLHHTTERVDHKQRRFVGRDALVPDVDLDDYRFRAVIDWIEIEAHFSRRTQVQHVQKVLRQFLDRNSFIDPLTDLPGGVFSSCKIKVQEPRSFAMINTIFGDLTDTFGEAQGPRVTGLEVSIDAYPKSPSYVARAQLLGALQRTIWTDRNIWSNSDSRPRCAVGSDKDDVFKLSPSIEVDGSGECRSQPENHEIPLINGTMYLGAKDDEVMIRLMDKVKDRQRSDEDFTALSEDEKRVRFEVTLRGQELLKLGVTDVQSLRRLELTKMQGRYFQFRLPTFIPMQPSGTGVGVARNEREAQRAKTYLRAGVTALMRMDDRIDLNQRAHRKNLLTALRLREPARIPTWKDQRLAAPLPSWKPLARKVHLALSDLAKREARAWSGKQREQAI